MSREIHHPPTPRGATAREQRAIERFHRATTAGTGEDARRVLGDALALVVELIEDRVSRRGIDADFGEARD